MPVNFLIIDYAALYTNRIAFIVIFLARELHFTIEYKDQTEHITLIDTQSICMYSQQETCYFSYSLRLYYFQIIYVRKLLQNCQFRRVNRISPIG
jgi:hypothetical protein